MAASMPKISIEFRRAAESVSARSTQGTVILLMTDTTAKDTEPTVFLTAEAAQAAAKKYTPANLQYILDAFSAGAAKVATVRIGDSITDALSIIASSALTGYVTVAAGNTPDFTALVTWIRNQETAGRSQYTGIVFNATAPNCQHVINFTTTTVTFADGRGQVSGAQFLPTLAGIIAGCGVTRSCTYFNCTMLSAATETAEKDDALAAGKLFLFSDGADIRIACGINSLTDTSVDDDLKYIDTVAVMDMIQHDITRIWKNSFAGRYRNTKDNQMLLVAAIKTYFSGLAAESILDPDSENTVAIDVETQRKAWISAGKAEAADWTDATVMVKTFRRDVYLTGTIRIVGTMDNIKFPITLT